MGIRLEINARNDSPRDGKAFAADGIADDADLRFELGNGGADFENGQFGERREVLDREDREIAIVGDVLDLGSVFFGRAVDVDEETFAVGNDVRVGEKLIGADEESRADAATESSCIPGRCVVGSLGGYLNAYDRTINVRCAGGYCCRLSVQWQRCK